MPYLIGGAIAVSVCLMAQLTGFDKDRSFYPFTLMVVGSYYVLFAVMGGTAGVIVVETLGLALFLVAAIVGYRVSAWITAVGLAAHGVLDAFHGQLLNNPGVPAWWPAFCGTYDVVAALFLASLIIIRASPSKMTMSLTRKDPQGRQRWYGQSSPATSSSTGPATSNRAAQ